MVKKSLRDVYRGAKLGVDGGKCPPEVVQGPVRDLNVVAYSAFSVRPTVVCPVPSEEYALQSP